MSLCHFCLGRRSPLSATLLLLDHGHGRWNVLDTTVAAVGPRVKLSVIVEVVLAVELVLAAELAREAVRAFAVESGYPCQPGLSPKSMGCTEKGKKNKMN